MPTVTLARPGFTTIITCVRVGTRTVSGTDFPVQHAVQRFAPPLRRPVWTVVLGLTNGVPDAARAFPTRRAALDAFYAHPDVRAACGGV